MVDLIVCEKEKKKEKETATEIVRVTKRSSNTRKGEGRETAIYEAAENAKNYKNKRND